MERTTKPTKKESQESKQVSPEKVLWIKTGSGYFVLGDQTYYPGDRFEATEKEIHDSYRDTIKKVAELSKRELEQYEKERVERPSYMERKAGGKYYVYSRGQRMNDVPLSRSEAEKLLSEL